QNIIDMFSDDSNKEVAVIDDSNELFEPFETTLEATDDTIKPVLYEDGLEAGKKDVEDEIYEALLVLDMNEDQVPAATLFMNSVKEGGLQANLEETLQQLK